MDRRMQALEQAMLTSDRVWTRQRMVDMLAFDMGDGGMS